MFCIHTRRIFTSIYFCYSTFSTCCIENNGRWEFVICSSPWYLCSTNTRSSFLIMPTLSSLLCMMKIFSKPVDMMKHFHFRGKNLYCVKASWKLWNSLLMNDKIGSCLNYIDTPMHILLKTHLGFCAISEFRSPGTNAYQEWRVLAQSIRTQVT